MPVLLSEFSPELLAGISRISGPAYLEWLLAFGYRIGVVGRAGLSQIGLSSLDVMAAYEAAGLDHIDIICLPPGVDDSAVT